jgi:hypothetical protein
MRVALSICRWFVFNAIFFDMAIDSASRHDDGCHAFRVYTNSFIEIAHQYNIVAITL